jgi:hypothetical protein
LRVGEVILEERRPIPFQPLLADERLNIAPDRLLDLARDHGVPVVRYESRDLRDDLVTLAKLERGSTSGA